MEDIQCFSDEWKGQKSEKFGSNKKHIQPITPKEIPHPLYSMFGKKHYHKGPTPTYEWRSSVRKLDPVDHANDRSIGIKKIITHYVIVKPRVERVHFVEKSNKGSLEDLMSGKMFL